MADARVVLDRADPKFRERVEAGGIVIDNAALIVKHTSQEHQRKIAGLDNEKIQKVGAKIKKHLNHLRNMDDIRSQPLVIPEGRFNVIVIDPPWDLEKVGADLEARSEGESVELPYPLMEFDQIRAWGLEYFFPDKRTATDCHLFLWVPNAFLERSFGLARDWGFEPSRVHTWNKKTPNGKPYANFFGPGLPGYNSEFVLYARRGSPRFDHIAGSGFMTCFDGVKQKEHHSRKPDEFYEMIRTVTDGRRIDVFARETREGFELCGNEVDKFLPAPATPNPNPQSLEELGL